MKVLKVGIPAGIVVVIIIVAIIFSPNQEVFENKIKNNNLERQNQLEKEGWQRSGPFHIDKNEYFLGEKIFLNIQNIKSDDKGEIMFLRPANDTHRALYLSIPFDGMKKSSFNYYFQPDLQKSKGTCSVNDIVGKWMVVFFGTQYVNISFEVLNQTSSWDDRTFEPVC